MSNTTNREPLAPASGSATCYECGGSHEPSGARSDCIRHWKLRAIQAENKLAVAKNYGGNDDELYHKLVGLVEWAETLLCNAECPKHCEPDEWCAILKRWRDEMHDSHKSPNRELSHGSKS